MDLKLTRKELYNLVWSKPLTHIAKEYGFSDNGIRKICIKNNIPLPKAGYWAKIKRNKKVKKERLLQLSNNPEIKLENTNPIVLEGKRVLSEIAFILKSK